MLVSEFVFALSIIGFLSGMGFLMGQTCREYWSMDQIEKLTAENAALKARIEKLAQEVE